MTGKVYLVGSGPGGRDLMTIRAEEVISKADVILFDQLPGDEILASLPKYAEKIDCGKFGGNHLKEQDEIENIMVKNAIEGKNVVRLKGGDPFLFGRGGEEMEVLRSHGIPVELVPGVTSAIAVPGSAGIPVTHRSYASSVTIITGNEDPGKEDSSLDWQWLARNKGTLVILMGVGNLAKIVDALTRYGKDTKTPVGIIERGMRKDKRLTIGDLSDIVQKSVERSISAPAIIVIGDVVRLCNESDPWLIPV